jgi:peroxiredoxin
MANRSRHRIAGALIAIVTILGAPGLSRAEVTDLLGKLNLSAYLRGTKSPEFNGRTADGRAVSLTSARGKVVLLNFWATWCQECRPEMPLFERLHREFAQQGLSVIGINAREGTPAIQKYAKELDLTFPLVLDLKGEINAAYGVIGLPTTFLIGRDGRAVARGIGPRDWGGASAKGIIQALLAEPAVLRDAKWTAWQQGWGGNVKSHKSYGRRHRRRERRRQRIQVYDHDPADPKRVILDFRFWISGTILAERFDSICMTSWMNKRSWLLESLPTIQNPKL